MPPEEITPQEEVEVEIPAEEVEEEIESDDEPSPEELSEAEQKEAKNLYKLLKDPNTQKQVLRVLAQSAGVLEQPPQTREEVKETKKDIQKILEEKLGSDFKWLVPKLSGALEEILEQEREERSVELSALTEKETINEVVRVSEKLNRETKGEYKKLENRMNQLADEILPAPGMSVEKYCRHLYAIASSEIKVNTQKNKLADKINRNASNASERLRSTSAGTERGKAPDKPMTLKQAVQFAAKQQEK
jgi:hypothetical protein